MAPSPDPSIAGPARPMDSLPDWLVPAYTALPVGTGVVEPSGRLIWANEALEQLAGRAVAGGPATEVVHPAERAAVLHLLSADRAGSEADAAESTALLRSRTAGRWLRMTVAPLSDAAGSDLRLLTFVDASDQVLAQRSLEVMSQNALDIVAITDSRGRISWVSPSVRIVLGRDPDSLVGRDLASLAAPDDLLGLSDVLAGAEAGQEPTTRTVRFRSATGAFRYMSVTARPVEDSDPGANTAVALRDITEELRAKRELARSEDQFRMAMQGAPEGMAVTDSQDRIIQANPALCELLGTSAAALVGHRFREYIPVEDREQVDQWRDRMLRGVASIERCQHRLAGPASEVWVDHSIGVMRDELGNPQLFVHQFADRTAARRLQADLAYRANHDVQTGLVNRDSLRTRLGQRLGSPSADSDTVGILFCDIDNLKPINDRYGHLIGDAVISAVATRLERAVRRQDIVARVGGDEFVIVLDHCPSVDGLGTVARNVHASASHPVETSAGPLDVTITVGAVLVESTADTDEALARADEALYRAKRAGRNRFSVSGLADG